MSNERNENIRRFERKQIAVAGLGLLVFIGGSLVANYLHINAVAVQTTQFISRMIQQDDFREVGLTLQETKLNYFRRIEYKSERAGRSFSLPEIVLSKNPVWDYLSSETVTLPTDNPLRFNNRDQITFEYNRFRLVPYALLAWAILVLVSIPQTRIVKKNSSASLKKISRQNWCKQRPI